MTALLLALTLSLTPDATPKRTHYRLLWQTFHGFEYCPLRFVDLTSAKRYCRDFGDRSSIVLIVSPSGKIIPVRTPDR